MDLAGQRMFAPRPCTRYLVSTVDPVVYDGLVIILKWLSYQRALPPRLNVSRGRTWRISTVIIRI